MQGKFYRIMDTDDLSGCFPSYDKTILVSGCQTTLPKQLL